MGPHMLENFAVSDSLSYRQSKLSLTRTCHKRQDQRETLFLQVLAIAEHSAFPVYSLRNTYNMTAKVAEAYLSRAAECCPGLGSGTAQQWSSC